MKGYWHRLIEGLSASSLGDLKYTDLSFPVIKMTDKNLSSLIQSEVLKCTSYVCVCVGVCEDRPTWNTVRMAAGNVSKFVVGVSSSKLNLKKIRIRPDHSEKNRKTVRNDETNAKFTQGLKVPVGRPGKRYREMYLF